MVLLWGILGGVFMLLVQICTAQNTGRTNTVLFYCFAYAHEQGQSEIYYTCVNV